MRIGLGAPVSGAWATAENVARFAKRAEELGYDSLWSFQRLLAGADDELAPVYRSVLDPMLALTYAAAHTTRIRLGVSVVNMPFVSPVLLAKQATTLDVLSGGRRDRGAGQRLVRARVRRHRRLLGPARGPRGGVRAGAAHALGRRGLLVRRLVLHGAAEPDSAAAGTAGWTRDPTRRRGAGGAEAGRPAGRGLALRQRHRPGPDRRADRNRARGGARRAADPGARGRPGGSAAGPAVRLVRRYPRGRGVARRAGRDRAVLRPQLGRPDRQPRRAGGRGHRPRGRAHRRAGTGTRLRASATTMSPPNTSAASSWKGRGSG